MKAIKKIIKLVNSILLGLIFLLITFGSAISPAKGDGVGLLAYISYRNIIFYTLYFLFAISLVKYIRNKNRGIHNLYLALVLSGVSWVIILTILFFPIFTQIGDGQIDSQVEYYAELIKLAQNIKNKVDTMTTIPLFYYDYLLDFIVSYLLVSLLGIFMSIPIAIYSMKILTKNKRKEKLFFRTGVFFILIVSAFLIFKVIFGNLISEALYLYKKKETVPHKVWVERKFSFNEKIENLQFAKEKSIEFLSKLNTSPGPLLSVMFATIFLILGITNKKLNTQEKNILDEYN